MAAGAAQEEQMELNVKVEISADQLREAVEQVASDVARETVDDRLSQDVAELVGEEMSQIDPTDYWSPRDIVDGVEIDAGDIENLTDYILDVLSDDGRLDEAASDIKRLKEQVAELVQANTALYDEVIQLKRLVRSLVDVVGRASTEISNLQVL